jgi:hypothetical protein
MRDGVAYSPVVAEGRSVPLLGSQRFQIRQQLLAFAWKSVEVIDSRPPPTTRAVSVRKSHDAPTPVRDQETRTYLASEDHLSDHPRQNCRSALALPPVISVAVCNVWPCRN